MQSIHRTKLAFVALVAFCAAAGCATAGAQQSQGPCQPADSAAASYRSWLVRFFSEPLFEPARARLSLSTVPADSITQVADTTLCANALDAVGAAYGTPGLATPVYLFRAQQSYAMFFPPDSTQISRVFHLTDSLQFLGAGIR